MSWSWLAYFAVVLAQGVAIEYFRQLAKTAATEAVTRSIALDLEKRRVLALEAAALQRDAEEHRKDVDGSIAAAGGGTAVQFLRDSFRSSQS